MLNKRLNEAKEQVIPEIKMQITKIIIQLNNEINKYIDNQCEMICTNTEYAYNQILINMKQDVYKQLEEKGKQENKYRQNLNKQRVCQKILNVLRRNYYEYF